MRQMFRGGPGRGKELLGNYYSLEAQLPIHWIPVIGSLFKLILSITQEPTMWVPGLLGIVTIIIGGLLLQVTSAF